MHKLLYLSNQNWYKVLYVTYEGYIPTHKGKYHHKNDVKNTNEVYESLYKLTISILSHVVHMVAYNITKVANRGSEN